MRSEEIDTRLRFWRQLAWRAFAVTFVAAAIAFLLWKQLPSLRAALYVIVAAGVVAGGVSVIAGIALTLRLFGSRT